MATMHETMGLAVVGLAVVGSISVAVVVEWVSLWGLMKMMPGPEPVAAPGADEDAATPAVTVTANARDSALDLT
jgi:hypothetical protein